MFRQLLDVLLSIASFCGFWSPPPNSARAPSSSAYHAASLDLAVPPFTATPDPAVAARAPISIAASYPAASTSDASYPAASKSDASYPAASKSAASYPAASKSSSAINQLLLSMPQDLTAKTLHKLIDHLNHCIDSGSSLQGSYLEWEKYTSNVPDLLERIQQEAEAVVTTKGMTDTILPVLTDFLEGMGFLPWVAVGLKMLAFGMERLDKGKENFEDCLVLLKNTLFLLKHTRKMWAKEETMSLGSHEYHLLKSNLPRIVEAAVKASVICASCGLNSNDEQTTKVNRYVDMARTFLGAGSLEASIGKLKEEIRDLMLQNLLKRIPRKLQYSELPQNYRPDMTEEIQRMLGVESEEIIAVCIHGMGGVGKSTLALHVLNSLINNVGTQFTRSSVVFELHLQKNQVEKEITRLQNQILKDISNKLDVEGKLSYGDISDASDGREWLQRAFQKSGNNPILLYIDNVHQQQHLLDLLPNVNHLPRGSRLLVTTRNKNISAAVSMLGVKNDACHSIHLKKLEFEASRTLLRREALKNIENKGIIDSDETLKALEIEVLRLCAGLPLALSLMGSYIAYSQKGGAESAETWRYVVRAMTVGAERDVPLYGLLRISIDALDESLRKEVLDWVMCGFFRQRSFLREILEWLVGAEEVENLIARHIIKSLDDDNNYVVCHDVIQSLVKYMYISSTEELRVTGEDLDKRLDGELECMASMGDVTITDVQRLNKMKRLRYAASVKVKVGDEDPAAAIIPIDLPDLKFLQLEMYKPPTAAQKHSRPVVKLRNCRQLRLLSVQDDVADFDWQFLSCCKLNSLCFKRYDTLTTFPPRGDNTNPDFFTSLSHLSMVDCGSLQEIPDSIGRLSQLTKLVLSGCKKLQHLPQGIRKLTNLQALSIKDCRSLQEIPHTIGYFSQLTMLDMSGCEKLQHLFPGISQLINMQALWMKDCRSLHEIPDTIGQLSRLTYLNMSGCEKLHHLPQSIGHLRNMLALSMENCRGLQEIPDTIGRLSQLTILDMSGCENLYYLPQGIGQLTQIHEISMKDCRNLREIPETICRLSQLTILDASGCEKLQHLPQGIWQLTQIQELWMEHCLSLQDLQIPKTIYQLSPILTRLNINGCEKLQHLPQGISQLIHMQELWMKDCRSLHEIPHTIGRLSRLTYLNMSGCEKLQHLPQAIGQLRNMQELWMRDCQSIQEIPESITCLSQLKILDISGCEKLHHLPQGIGQLRNMHELWMKDCQSLQDIPESICRLAQLTKLMMFGCEKLQYLPQGIWQITSLAYLSLKGCTDLHSLPKGITLQSLPSNLSLLNLNSCWRLKMLPEGMSLLTSLRVLNLEFCASLQCIPVGIGQLTNLRFLSFHACSSLKKLPDAIFDNLANNLLHLELSNCKSLETLPQGISLLTLLTELRIDMCASLEFIPEGIGQVIHGLRGCARLKCIPHGVLQNIFYERALQTLDLSFCERIEMLPEEISFLTSLTELRLQCCRSLQCIPQGIKRLVSLQKLTLYGCKSLQKLPNGMFDNVASSLLELDLSFCDKLEMLPQGFSLLTTLTDLRLECCGSLRCIPGNDIKQFASLQNLCLHGCSSMEGLPHGTFENVAGNLLVRERKVNKKRNLIRQLLYMVSMEL